MKSNQIDLFAACKAGSMQDVELILQSQPKDIVNTVSNDLREDSPLTLSASIGNIELCKLLIAKGANVNYKKKNSLTPFWTALFLAENFHVCELLLENGADINSSLITGQTPLFMAAFLKSREKVLFLIENGAEINAKDMYGVTPIIIFLTYHIDYFHDILENLKKSHNVDLNLNSVTDYISTFSILEAYKMIFEKEIIFLSKPSKQSWQFWKK